MGEKGFAEKHSGAAPSILAAEVWGPIHLLGKGGPTARRLICRFRLAGPRTAGLVAG
jgi:hypothetical protein